MEKERSSKASAWDLLAESVPKPCVEECPRMTTIIWTYKCPHQITQTLESVVAQDYPDFEIVVVDASSPDRTTEVVASFHDPRIRLYTVTDWNPYEMLNRGVSLCTGRYVNILFPGDYYLSSETLKFVAARIGEEASPDLMYSACIVRDSLHEERLLYRPLTLDYIKTGRQPTSLQACWWRTDTLVELGKFDKSLSLRGGFDLMSRFLLKEGLRHVSMKRVLTESSHRGISNEKVYRHFSETVSILRRWFGTSTALHWLFSQRDLYRMWKLWLGRVRVAFLGRS